MSVKISQQAYDEMFGPTLGNRVRLADTELWIEAEEDLPIYGEEVKFGGGKIIRDGMGQGQRVAAEVANTVITNALIVDHWGNRQGRHRPQGHHHHAEDILHDLGALSMMSSDSQAMGRVGEVIIRTWQTAHKMKVQRGHLAAAGGPAAAHDNFRVKRYLAKYTINPAITHGISHLVGSIAIGKLADLVLWKPAFFGVKPSLILKGGMIAAAAMGDANASIPTPQPVHYRPMFGAFGRALKTSVTFVSQAALDNPEVAALQLSKPLVAVRGTRAIGKAAMVHNSAMPKMAVDPETYAVRADGELLVCEPARVLPLAQRYFLF